jgi:hypothetical protein
MQQHRQLEQLGDIRPTAIEVCRSRISEGNAALTSSPRSQRRYAFSIAMTRARSASTGKT